MYAAPPLTIAIFSILIAIFIMALKPPPEPTNELVRYDDVVITSQTPFEPIAIDISDAKFISFLGKTDTSSVNFKIAFLSNIGIFSDLTIPRQEVVALNRCALSVIQSMVQCPVFQPTGPFLAVRIVTTDTGVTATITLHVWIQR